MDKEFQALMGEKRSTNIFIAGDFFVCFVMSMRVSPGGAFNGHLCDL